MVIKHKKSHNRQCATCKEFYNEVLYLTKKIRRKGTREGLLRLWETLWLNGFNDFDIVLYELNWKELSWKRGRKK